MKQAPRAFLGILEERSILRRADADDAVRTATAQWLEASIKQYPGLSVHLLTEICVSPRVIAHCLICVRAVFTIGDPQFVPAACDLLHLR
jgi:hypothetical protein